MQICVSPEFCQVHTAANGSEGGRSNSAANLTDILEAILASAMSDAVQEVTRRRSSRVMFSAMAANPFTGSSTSTARRTDVCHVPTGSVVVLARFHYPNQVRHLNRTVRQLQAGPTGLFRSYAARPAPAADSRMEAIPCLHSGPGRDPEQGPLTNSFRHLNQSPTHRSPVLRSCWTLRRPRRLSWEES